MRLQASKSKNAASLYVIKTVYIDKKEHTITVKNLVQKKNFMKNLMVKSLMNGQKNILKN
jgi:hypothetical protein